jgi:hypothetical protein
MTEKEIARKNELLEVLETISQLMEQLAILEVLPDDLEQREFVCNRALDVRSASMIYLAVRIRHHSIRGGIPGTFPGTHMLIGISEGVESFLHGGRNHGSQSAP